ncbi:hypothetical protein [Leifsonia sp. 21MFCrub1.1]|uniref:hypothetical protein n=1 Tax=Leifsonia sp. 21MFCrub1.1 TaxID=1798223 RepID=UPI0008929034|nr:hypothetical protein [Leifsonia sp. 21MFCrub1.1]SEA63029.1 hypothetical protein SAMN04515680_0973 [Leifsonia sp. 21MFCrub1.1]
MKAKWLFLILGIVLVLIGLLWTLQGLNVLGGSVMSGSPLWGTIGPIVLIVGVVLIVVALLRRRRGSDT